MDLGNRPKYHSGIQRLSTLLLVPLRKKTQTIPSATLPVEEADKSCHTELGPDIKAFGGRKSTGAICNHSRLTGRKFEGPPDILEVVRGRFQGRPVYPGGSTQIGDDHARSRIVAGTLGSGGMPKRIASYVDQRQVGF